MNFFAVGAVNLYTIPFFGYGAGFGKEGAYKALSRRGKLLNISLRNKYFLFFAKNGINGLNGFFRKSLTGRSRQIR